MDFTISQIGAIANRQVSPAQPLRGETSPSAEVPSRPVDAVPSPAAAGLHGLETEYDEFGRFSAGASAAVEADRPSDERPPPNPAAKYFRAGKVTAEELEREYIRSLVDSYVADEQGGGVRRFIPAGMTEYQVNQLSDYQYRWAIEAERRALERAERQNASAEAPAAKQIGADPLIR